MHFSLTDDVKVDDTKDRVAQFVLDTIKFTENQAKCEKAEEPVVQGDHLEPVHRPLAQIGPTIHVQE